MAIGLNSQIKNQKLNGKQLNRFMKIHFIGIGGIGISALAKFYLQEGHKITGSDLVPFEDFKKEEFKIFIGHSAKNLPKNTDFVIYTPAIPASNPELKEAKRLKIKCLTYPEALGELTKKYFTIAVSGTHGKSTTTAMIGLLLQKAGFDPTVIVGTKLKEFNNSNLRVGKSKYLVIEADEHMASFLNYWPQIIILTNIEEDHLDFYKNLQNIMRAFKKYISRLPKNGVLIMNKDDKNINKIISNFSAKGRPASGGQSSIFNKISTINFQLKSKEAKKLKKILKVPGNHNISNSLAALSLARVLGISDKISFKALSEFKGTWRRFEEFNIKIGAKKIKVISDFAHHPTEIKASLKGIREKYPAIGGFARGGKNKKIWCFFQPHQYQRTFYLFSDFVKVLKNIPINKLFITDIYDVAGREDKGIKEKISAEKLVKKIKKSNVSYIKKEKIVSYIKENIQGGEAEGAEERSIIVIMGAGDIYKIIEKLK